MDGPPGRVFQAEKVCYIPDNADRLRADFESEKEENYYMKFLTV